MHLAYNRHFHEAYYPVFHGIKELVWHDIHKEEELQILEESKEIEPINHLKKKKVERNVNHK